MESNTSFDITEARELYNIDRWSGGYFGINDAGHVCVFPKRNGETIDLMDVVAEARSRKLAFPLVVRFHDLLRDRVETINKAFATAIAAGGTALKAPEKVFWGGYSGYWADVDGHVWEVAMNPFWPLSQDGSLTLP